jgi:flavin-dependent dehydrogenase
VEESFDVVVAGGGPAGASAAITLATAGLRVLLAEAAGSSAFKIGESLPPAATPLLYDLGVLDRVAQAGHHMSPGNVTIWGGAEPASHDFILDPNGHGWHLHRPRFEADLRAAACDAGAVVRERCRVRTCQFDLTKHSWYIALAEGGDELVIKAPWVLDGTGRRGLIAGNRGSQAIPRDRLVAHCAIYCASSSDIDHRTYVEAAPDGWWYSALLPGGHRVVAYFTDSDLSFCTTLLRTAAFAAHVKSSRYLCCLLGDALPRRVYRFACHSSTRSAFAGIGWLTIGDASLTFDPLSSQGLFHALYTGLRGAQAVADALDCKYDTVANYEQRLRSIELAYRVHLSRFYGAERRWIQHTFWKRRQGRD